MPVMRHVLWAYQQNLDYAKRLVDDLTDAQMTAQPALGGGAVLNHPAWILGHLSMPREWMKDLLRLRGGLNPQWVEKFNMMTKPSGGGYPAKAELIAALEETHRQMVERVKTMTEAELAAPPADAEMRQYCPTMGDGIVGLLTTHEAGHLGQLSAWRRAMGLPQV